MSNIIAKKIAAAVGALVITAGLGACSTANTGPDMMALHYSGGPFSSVNFKNCIEPGKLDYDGPGDNHYYYPSGQRTFSFTGRNNSESPQIAIKTKDSQQMMVAGFIAFELSSDCETLRKFHETVGIKLGAYFTEDGKSEGWTRFISDYLLVPTNSVMDKAGLEQDWRTLYSSSQAQSDFEDYVMKNLPGEIDRAIGSKDFIKITSINIETPTPSEALLKSLEEVEAAKSQVEVQKQKNAVTREQYKSLEECKKVVSEENCVMIRLVESGKVTIVYVPRGSAIAPPPQNPPK